MKNYGEILAYWYLRFNGFFPLTNFVLHRDEDEAEAGDCDLVAVRFPHVYENVGGQIDDWDHRLFEMIGIAPDHAIIGLVVEVKVGQIKRGALSTALSVDRLRKAIHRMGFFPLAEVARIAETFEQVPTYSQNFNGNDFVLGKLVIRRNHPRREPKYLPCLLSNVDQFIKDRINRYRNDKNADRLFFHDPLIQYLMDARIWEYPAEQAE